MSISRKEELFPENLDDIRPSELVRSVDDIDFAAYREAGVRHWGFDIEGTIARGQSSHPMIPERLIDHLKGAKERGEIDTLFLLTNKRVKSEGQKVGDTEFAKKAATLVGADYYFVREPDVPGKPNKEIMINALRHMHIDPLETAYVGDKLTADVRVANDAGLAESIWVNPRLGVQDHPGDWFVRRPIELVHARRLELHGRTPGVLGELATKFSTEDR